MKNACIAVLIYSLLFCFPAYSEELDIKTNKADVKLLGHPGNFSYEILVNGKSVLKEDGQIMSFKFNEHNDSYFWGDNEYIIVEITTGGSGCPAFFRVLDPNNEQNQLTKEFGTCSDSPRITESKNGLILSFPTRETDINRVWKYANGVLTE